MPIFHILGKLKHLLKRDKLLILIVAISLNLLLGVLFYFAERNAQEGLTLPDALWWAMVTMTTVGYGDYYAQTALGRFLISYPCMLLGIGVLGYLVGIMSNALLDIASKLRKGLMNIEFKNHIIICNLPSEKKILNIIKELKAAPQYSNKKIVLITDIINELSESLKNEKVHFIHGSPTDEAILLKSNILHCDGVIILAEDPTNIRSDERTFMIGSLVEMMEKQHNTPIKTITEIVASDNVKNIERAGVDGYISEDGMAGCLLVQEFINPGINRIISQVISNSIGSQFYIHTTKLTGFKIRDVQIAALEHDINMQIIGLTGSNENILNPSKNTVIKKDDQLIVLAEKADDYTVIESEILNKNK